MRSYVLMGHVLWQGIGFGGDPWRSTTVQLRASAILIWVSSMFAAVQGAGWRVLPPARFPVAAVHSSMFSILGWLCFLHFGHQGQNLFPSWELLFWIQRFLVLFLSFEWCRYHAIKINEFDLSWIFALLEWWNLWKINVAGIHSGVFEGLVAHTHYWKRWGEVKKVNYTHILQANQKPVGADRKGSTDFSESAWSSQQNHISQLSKKWGQEVPEGRQEEELKNKIPCLWTLQFYG